MKRLVAHLADDKYLTILFTGKHENRLIEDDVLFVITGEESPHVRRLSICKAEKIVSDAGYSYVIEEIPDTEPHWWK